MAENQSGSNRSNGQVGPGESPEAESRANSSQTMPVITEELMATHTTTTPVMPPNPIRRSEAVEPPMTAATTQVQPETGQDSTPGAGDAEGEKKGGSGISATQLLAGAGAAATSSVIGGQLGVAGTVVGAGVASIITALAVSLYSKSLDKGREKIKEVGSKLAPAVKAQANLPGEPSAFGGGSHASVADDESADPDAPAADEGSAAEEGPSRTWWQQLRRKRVIYPVSIGVAAFAIGLGGVVMAESFTDADISPGTSQISRSVSSGSTGSDTGDSTFKDGGSSSSGSSAGTDSSGSRPGESSQQGSGSQSSTNTDGESTAADDTGNANGTDSTGSTDSNGSDQGTDTGSGESAAGSGSDSGSSSGSGSGSAGGSSSQGGGSGSGAGGSSGSSSGSGSGGGSGSGSSGSGSGSGGSGSGGSGGGSTAAQG